MTVADLIAELQKLPPTMKVWHIDAEMFFAPTFGGGEVRVIEPWRKPGCRWTTTERTEQGETKTVLLIG